MIKCPCCRQPWHDVERIRLLDAVVLTPRGAVALSPREEEIVTFGLMRKPWAARDLAEHMDVSEDCLHQHIRNTNRRLRAKGWHFAQFNSTVTPQWGLCEIIRHPDGSFVQTHDMKGPAALKPQWHHA